MKRKIQLKMPLIGIMAMLCILQLRAQLTLSTDINMLKGLSVTNHTDFGPATTSGNGFKVHINSGSTTTDALGIEGNIGLTGNVSTPGNINLGGTLNVTGNSNLNNVFLGNNTLNFTLATIQHNTTTNSLEYKDWYDHSWFVQGAKKMELNYLGDLTIGRNLNVTGDVDFPRGIYLGALGDPNYYITNNANNVLEYRHWFNHAWFTQGIKRMGIDVYGNVTIGGTQPAAYNQQLYVQNGIGTWGNVYAYAGFATPASVAAGTEMTAPQFRTPYHVWADNVFEPNYNLQPLTQLEDYINTNKHLPKIPSANEIEKNGFELTDMATKQMEKIEELTLYLIDMNKKIEVLQAENVEIKKQLTQLKK